MTEFDELLQRVEKLPAKPKAPEEVLAKYASGLIDGSVIVPKFLHSDIDEPLEDLPHLFLIFAEPVGFSIMMKPILELLAGKQMKTRVDPSLYRNSFLYFLDLCEPFDNFKYFCSLLTVEELVLIAEVLQSIADTDEETFDKDMAEELVQNSRWRYFLNKEIQPAE